MKVAWTREAWLDRIEIWSWIAADDPNAATHMDQTFGSSASRLAQHPKLGRDGKIPGTRELVVHESYQLVYKIDQENKRILILAVVHNHRQWPPLDDSSD